MTELPLLMNVAAYSAQVLCIAALGGLLSAVVRVHTPAVRYAFWRGLVVVCLALPWLQGRQIPTIDTGVLRESVFLLAPATGVVEHDPAPTSPLPSPASLPAWPAIALGVLAAGAGARLLWLTAGLLRLRRLRYAGHPADLSAREAVLCAAIAPRAAIREVAGLHQPVTFGLLRPVVLLPPSLRECDTGIREAVLCHELHHARRGDWASVLVEELVLCALWFHPAAWWLVTRVQLSREEVVDELVVRTIGTRRTYIEALMLLAGERGMVTLPAPAFSRRQHLFRRIVLLSKETRTTMPRLLSSLCVWAAAIVAGIWYAPGIFPLSAATASPAVSAEAEAGTVAPTVPGELAMPGRSNAPLALLERSADGGASQPVSALQPAEPARLGEQSTTPSVSQVPQPAPLPERPRQTVRIPVAAPPELEAISATGVVLIRLTIDAAGQVADSHLAGYAISATNPARYRAVQEEPLPPVTSVFPDDPAWQAAAEAMNRAALAAARQFRFEPPTTEKPQVYAAVMVPSLEGLALVFPNRPAIPAVDPSALAATGGPGIGAFTSAASPATVDSDLRARAEAAAEAARRSRAAAQNSAAQPQQGGAPGPSAAGIAAGTPTPTAVVAPQPPPPPPTGPVRVGGNIAPPKKIKDVKPAYPAEALDNRIQGIVIIEAVIGPSGTVTEARVLRSIPALDDAAVEAVKQWEFTPTLLNGVPVAIVMSVTVNFTLN